MDNRPTDDLMNTLLNKNSISSYLKENDNSFITETFADYYNSVLKEKNITKSEAIRTSGMDAGYAYQILRQHKKNPSRDIVLCLAFGAHMTITETQRALMLSDHSVLYPKKRRDSIILFALKNSLSIDDCNERLASEGETPLTG